MKKIDLETALSLLEECSGIVIDNVITYPNLAELNGEPENQWMHIGWMDEEGVEYSITFGESNNTTIEVVGSSMYLEDNEGDPVQLTLLSPWEIENE